MKPIVRALAEAARQLDDSSDTARLDSELLMAEALHIDRDKLILSPPDRQVPDRFWQMVERRKAGEPIAYITGRRAFWNIELHVGPGVLVPRPDSEVLIASAIEHFEGTPGPKRILDLGTGPGTLLLAALDVWPEATGLGIDVSRHAMSYAAANARRLGFEPRVKFKLGQLGRKAFPRTFDLILCNPPYVAEGAAAGRWRARVRAGRGAVRRRGRARRLSRSWRPQLPRLLNQGGLAAVEIGHDQAAAVSPLLARDGLDAYVSRRTWQIATGRCC